MKFHDFAATVFSSVNQELCISSFQQGNNCGSEFRGYLVKSIRYLIVIYFQGRIFSPHRPVFYLMILYGLYTLQPTQEKEKKVAQCSTG